MRTGCIGTNGGCQRISRESQVYNPSVLHRHSVPQSHCYTLRFILWASSEIQASKLMFALRAIIGFAKFCRRNGREVFFKNICWSLVYVFNLPQFRLRALPDEVTCVTSEVGSQGGQAHVRNVGVRFKSVHNVYPFFMETSPRK